MRRWTWEAGAGRAASNHSSDVWLSLMLLGTLEGVYAPPHLPLAGGCDRGINAHTSACPKSGRPDTVTLGRPWGKKCWCWQVAPVGWCAPPQKVRGWGHPQQTFTSLHFQSRKGLAPHSHHQWKLSHFFSHAWCTLSSPSHTSQE